MGFKLEYRIGNRKVSKREWERHMFEEAPQQLAEDALGEKLNNIRCPEHGQRPRLKNRRTTSEGLRFDIERLLRRRD